MKEPAPKNIAPPKSSPMMRVGVVLAEDNKSSLTFSLTESGYSLKTTKGSRDLAAGTKYVIAEASGEIEISGPTGKIDSDPSLLVLCAPSGAVLTPKAGICVEGIRAGRGFHWQKDLTEQFSGDLEIHRSNQHLVVVSVLPFEDYIASVTSSEMSPNCPEECAKAQAIVARSWSLVFLGEKHSGLPFSICNDDDCQRYQGSTHLLPHSIMAAKATCGEILVNKDGFITPTYYSKCCGGVSETSQNAFGFETNGLSTVCDSPSKKVVDLDLSNEDIFEEFLTQEKAEIYCSPGFIPEDKLIKYLGKVDESGKYFRWGQTIAAAEVVRNLTDKFGIQNVASLNSFQPGPRGVSGRITNLTLGWRDSTGKDHQTILNSQYDIRRALDQKFLKSSAFSAEINRRLSGEIDTLKLRGLGWGHGVGLCQIGALGMALCGRTCSEILNHYFPQSKLQQL